MINKQHIRISPTLKGIRTIVRTPQIYFTTRHVLLPNNEIGAVKDSGNYCLSTCCNSKSSGSRFDVRAPSHCATSCINVNDEVHTVTFHKLGFASSRKIYSCGRNKVPNINVLLVYFCDVGSKNINHTGVWRDLVSQFIEGI